MSSVTAFPRAKKRGRKVTRGPMADVLRFGPSLAERYARFMSLRCAPEHQEQSIREYLDYSQRMVAAGALTLDSLEDAIERKRDDLHRQLTELETI